ncbi:hypothetical protein UR09_01485 [Candidatus Nitromaritima sp. SCGC AAA799-A02]|nr:hypothetical protein UR09_01485 [Candidatus Nitromaritima sp. SCGC AAA799-A02]
MLIRTSECNQCGECCKTVNITAVRDVALRQHGSRKELELYLGYRGIRVVGEDVERNELHYTMDIPCDQLDPENRCKVHAHPEKKPLLCHRYPMEPPEVEECSYRFEKASLFGARESERLDDELHERT